MGQESEDSTFPISFVLISYSYSYSKLRDGMDSYPIRRNALAACCYSEIVVG